MSDARRSHAAFPTPYATLNVYDLPPKLEMSTIRGLFPPFPSPLDSFFSSAAAAAAVSIIIGTASQHVTYAPLNPTPWQQSHMSAPCFQKSFRKSAVSSPGGVWNADATATSRRPPVSSFTLSNRAWTSSSSLTSHFTGTPLPGPGIESISRAVCWTVHFSIPSNSRSVVAPPPPPADDASDSSDRPATYTVMPAAPSSSAMPLPMPRVAPVTTATRPERSGGTYASTVVVEYKDDDEGERRGGVDVDVRIVAWDDEASKRDPSEEEEAAASGRRGMTTPPSDVVVVVGRKKAASAAVATNPSRAAAVAAESIAAFLGCRINIVAGCWSCSRGKGARLRRDIFRCYLSLAMRRAE
mmetsp:Transcript_27889/g.81921  ORF Transcript_27889/g.81921 Transcript_27889/m.81921 type:complete len:355 (+) Transcript_27889:644-1708(+)